MGTSRKQSWLRKSLVAMLRTAENSRLETGWQFTHFKDRVPDRMGIGRSPNRKRHVEEALRFLANTIVTLRVISLQDKNDSVTYR